LQKVVGGATFLTYTIYTNTDTRVKLLLSWQSHCESSSGSSDECEAVPSGCQPSDQAVHYHLHPPCHLVLLIPKADTCFTIPLTSLHCSLQTVVKVRLNSSWS